VAKSNHFAKRIAKALNLFQLRGDLTEKRYTVIRNHRPAGSGSGIDTIEGHGLTWRAATALMDSLTKLEAQAKPGETSWTRDVFVRQLEG
jgi:hypothetical protein